MPKVIQVVNWYIYAALSIGEAEGILGLPSNYTLDDLNRKKRTMMRQWHTDINDSMEAEEMSKDINAAHALLRNSLLSGGIKSSPDIDVPVNTNNAYDSKQEHRVEMNFAFLDRIDNDLHLIVRGGVIDYSKMDTLKNLYISHGAKYWLYESSREIYIYRFREHWESYKKKKMSLGSFELLLDNTNAAFNDGMTMIEVNEMLHNLLVKLG